MMTRETKVGLVVSCSFLCLVGAVLYLRLKDGTGTPPDLYALAGKGMPAAPADPTPAGDSAAIVPPGAAAIVPAPATTSAVPPPASGTAPPAFDPKLMQAVLQTTPPASSGSADPGSPLPAGPKEPEKPGSSPAAPGWTIPPPPAADVKTPPAPGKPTSEDKTKPAPLTSDPWTAAPPSDLGKKPPTDPQNLSAAPADQKSPVEGVKQKDPAAEILPKPANANAVPTPPNKDKSSPFSDPFPSVAPPTPALTGAKEIAAAPKSGTTSAPESSGLSGSNGLITPPPPPPPAGFTATAPPPLAASSTGISAPENPGVNLQRPGTPGVLPNGRASSPPAADDVPESNVRLGAPKPSLPPNDQFAQGSAPPTIAANTARPAPPIGSPALVDSPPITVPAPPGAGRTAAQVNDLTPQVESYDEETYICRANDTLKDISKRFYHTEKYDRALLLFNRNHPRATDDVRQEPPVLREGYPIYIPPLRILEKQYAAAIPEHTPVPPPSAIVPSSAASGGNSPTSSAGERQYRVHKEGEMFYEIARRTLQSGDRWNEIYRLNPRFNPAVPVPTGTILRLPADARLNPEDTP